MIDDAALRDFSAQAILTFILRDGHCRCRDGKRADYCRVFKMMP